MVMLVQVIKPVNLEKVELPIRHTHSQTNLLGLFWIGWFGLDRLGGLGGEGRQDLESVVHRLM